MNPTGNTTTAFSPPSDSARRWSLTSGSSHGTDGGPDRDCHTRSNDRPGPPGRPPAARRSPARARRCGPRARRPRPSRSGWSARWPPAGRRPAGPRAGTRARRPGRRRWPARSPRRRSSAAASPPWGRPGPSGRTPARPGPGRRPRGTAGSRRTRRRPRWPARRRARRRRWPSRARRPRRRAPSCGCPSTPAGRPRPAQRGDQRLVLLVDRADAVEVVVVLGHALQPLARDAAAAGHVLQERHDLVVALGPAEAEHQQRLPPARRRRRGPRDDAAVVAGGERGGLVRLLPVGGDGHPVGERVGGPGREELFGHRPVIPRRRGTRRPRARSHPSSRGTSRSAAPRSPCPRARCR